MEVFSILACSGPGVDALINYNATLTLFLYCLMGVMIYCILRIQFSASIGLSIASSFLILIVFFLLGPKEGGDCGERDKTWALTFTLIFVAVFLVVGMGKLIPQRFRLTKTR